MPPVNPPIAGGWSRIVPWCLVIGAMTGVGCGAIHARTSFAREFHCPDERVAVDEIAQGRYKATGCSETAIYVCRDQRCARERPEPIQRELPAIIAVTREPEAPSTILVPPRREDRDDGTLLVLDLRLDNSTTLKLRAAPEAHADLVQLKVVRVERQSTLEDCELEWLIDGELRKGGYPKSSRQKNVTSLLLDVSDDLVRSLAVARKVALRVCEDRWSLDRDQVAAIKGFVELYQEDVAWQRPASGGKASGRTPPAGGWPRWRVAGVRPGATSEGKALDPRALFKLVSPSVFQVEARLTTGIQQGSGVAIGATELLTNCHVIEGAQVIVIRQGRREWKAAVDRADPKTDRCVLSVREGGLTPVRGIRAFGELEVGEPVFTVGSPSGLELTLSNGIVSGLRSEDGQSYVQTTAPISPGSSGGGLFDARGNVVGITTLVLAGRERLNQSLNFAIPADAFWQP